MKMSKLGWILLAVVMLLAPIAVSNYFGAKKASKVSSMKSVKGVPFPATEEIIWACFTPKDDNKFGNARGGNDWRDQTLRAMKIYKISCPAKNSTGMHSRWFDDRVLGNNPTPVSTYGGPSPSSF